MVGCGMGSLPMQHGRAARATRRSMMRIVVFIASIALFAGVAVGQPYGKADASSPGDEGIQKYLTREAAEMDAQFAEDVKSRKDWETKRPQYVEEYFYMLGLSPRPEKTDLKATVVRTLE